MAMAPHWLDDVIGSHRTVDAIEKAICSSRVFQTLVEKAIEHGLAAEEGERQGKVGSNYTQAVRAAICRGLEQNALDLDSI